MRRTALRVLAASALVAAAIGGCAEMSAGDCTDKGTCAPDDPIDAGSAASDTDAAADAGLDTRPDAVPDAPIDATHPDGASADAADDAITDAPEDDAALDGDADETDAPEACTLHSSCIEAPPAGWSGPVARAEATGAPPPTLADCAAPYDTLAFDGSADPSAKPAQCTCTCGAAANVVCPDPTIDLYAGASCAARCGGAAVAAGGCTTVSTASCGASVYIKAAAKPPTGGSCPPQPSAVVPAWHWERAARACALPTTAPRGGCAADEVCAPSPVAPFSGHLCIAAEGDLACPTSSHYTVRHVDFGGADDTRACSACTCDAPSGGTCAGSFSTFNTNACTLFTNTFTLASACSAVPITTASLQASAPVASGSQCTPSSVSPIGAVTPKKATTVCCLP